MAKAVTDKEVEDVLTSVRRLVSEDKNPKPVDAPGMSEEPPNEPLVLTPDRRVEPPATMSPSAEQEDDGAPTKGTVDDAALLADLHVFLSQDFDPKARDQKVEAKKEQAAPPSEPASISSSKIDKNSDNTTEKSAEKGVAAAKEEPKVNTVTAKIQSFEKTLDSIEARTSHQKSDASKQEVAVTEDAEQFEEEELLDEETLRKMIAEVVQSELEGAIGERITRNLRELVRREIKQAFEAERKK